MIVVTLDRPDYVVQCLDSLDSQCPRPNQVIVVDASAGNETAKVVHQRQVVRYARNESGFGRMTASRNIGLRYATGSVVAFLDDDAFVRPGWVDAIRAAYADPLVGAVGGRALNGQAGESELGRDLVGRILPNGMHTGFHAADPGEVIEVDHLMGCNMSFRRSVLAKLGGFREDYPGISGVREDTDMCLRVKALGYRVVFNPAAVVDHVGAPQAKGRRMDWRYVLYSVRNHVVMLGRNYPLGSWILPRYIAWHCAQSLAEMAKRLLSAFSRPVAVTLGAVLGLVALVRLGGYSRPERSDPEAEVIRRVLSAEHQEVEDDAVEVSA